MKKQKEKVSIILKAFDADQPEHYVELNLPIFKAAEIKLEHSDIEFFYLEKKKGKPGFTLNYSSNILPEGFKFDSLTFKREESSDGDKKN